MTFNTTLERTQARMIKVLVWLYTTDDTYKNKNEWRKGLVDQLMYLVTVDEDDEDEVTTDFSAYTSGGRSDEK